MLVFGLCVFGGCHRNSDRSSEGTGEEMAVEETGKGDLPESELLSELSEQLTEEPSKEAADEAGNEAANEAANKGVNEVAEQKKQPAPSVQKASAEAKRRAVCVEECLDSGDRRKTERAITEYLTTIAAKYIWKVAHVSGNPMKAEKEKKQAFEELSNDLLLLFKVIGDCNSGVTWEFPVIVDGRFEEAWNEDGSKSPLIKSDGQWGLLLGRHTCRSDSDTDLPILFVYEFDRRAPRERFRDEKGREPFRAVSGIDIDGDYLESLGEGDVITVGADSIRFDISKQFLTHLEAQSSKIVLDKEMREILDRPSESAMDDYSKQMASLMLVMDRFLPRQPIVVSFVLQGAKPRDGLISLEERDLTDLGVLQRLSHADFLRLLKDGRIRFSKDNLTLHRRLADSELLDLVTNSKSPVMLSNVSGGQCQTEALERIPEWKLADLVRNDKIVVDAEVVKRLPPPDLANLLRDKKIAVSAEVVERLPDSELASFLMSDTIPMADALKTRLPAADLKGLILAAKLDADETVIKRIPTEDLRPLVEAKRLNALHSAVLDRLPSEDIVSLLKDKVLKPCAAVYQELSRADMKQLIEDGIVPVDPTSVQHVDMADVAEFYEAKRFELNAEFARWLSIPYLKKAADDGNVEAMYFFATEKVRDPDIRYDYLKKASDHGHELAANALNDLSTYSEMSEGRLAPLADKGGSLACYSLALQYDKKADTRGLAFYYFYQASKAGDLPDVAKKLVESKLRGGDFVSRADSLPLDKLQQMAAGQNVDAVIEMARRYGDKHAGVGLDKVKAFALYRKAFDMLKVNPEKNTPDWKRRESIERGSDSVFRDKQSPVLLLEEKDMHPLVQGCLGDHYRRNFKYDKAYDFYIRACKAGHGGAYDTLYNSLFASDLSREKLEIAVEKDGNRVAMYYLATKHLFGKNKSEEEIERGLRMLYISGKLGCKSSTKELANCEKYIRDHPGIKERIEAPFELSEVPGNQK